MNRNDIKRLLIDWISAALSLTLWVKQLAIRLGCKIPQPSRWLSHKWGERSEGGEAGLVCID